MQRKFGAILAAAALVGFGLLPQHASAVVVFAPLQTNLTALGLDNSTVEASENVPAGSYESTGTGAGGNSSEISDAGGTATPGDQAIVEHYQTTDFPATSFFDVFVELSIPPGPLGSFQTQIINPTGEAQTISGAGFFLSPTEIPLDQLNETNYPDSMFTPIPSLNESLGAGGTDSADVVLPEPAALSILIIGALAIPGRRSSSRRK
jgi:hypothetical protein